MTTVPFVDLSIQYRRIKEEIDEAILSTVEDCEFIMGERVRQFEEKFAQFSGAKYGVACSSGTTALHLALLACQVGPGDEVILPSHTFIATGSAVVNCGATPVFADVNAETYNIEPSDIESLITDRTKCIIPVHLYGQCADLDPILSIAKKHDLRVINDSAQAHGARYKDTALGSLGDFSTYSFYPAKNLGAYGDAGMVVTNDAELANQMRMYANHGRTQKYEHEMIGYNYRMDSLQAAILSIKLDHLPTWINERKAAAKRYNELLADLPVTCPHESFDHVYHLYVIQCDRRDELREFLKTRGIGTGIHYPIPLHSQPCFPHSSDTHRTNFPNTDGFVDRILSLPIYSEVAREQQEYVTKMIGEFYSESPSSP